MIDQKKSLMIRLVELYHDNFKASQTRFRIKVGVKPGNAKNEKDQSSIKSEKHNPIAGEEDELHDIFKVDPKIKKGDITDGSNEKKVENGRSSPYNSSALTPTKPKPIRTDIEINEIEKRRGNYILTLGYPGCGKTVFQSFLCYFIDTAGEFSSSLEKNKPVRSQTTSSKI